MAPKAGQGRSNERNIQPFTGTKNTVQAKSSDYTSHGVKDNDIFLLPGSDLQLLGVLIMVAAIVRLFRIYQPSSVVFDEVQ